MTLVPGVRQGLHCVYCPLGRRTWNRSSLGPHQRIAGDGAGVGVVVVRLEVVLVVGVTVCRVGVGVGVAGT